jgi:hypothetical protein
MAPLRIGVAAVLLCGAGLLAFHEIRSDGLGSAVRREVSPGKGTIVAIASRPTAPRGGVGAKSSGTAIAFALDRAGAVDIEIFDLQGRTVATVARREYLAAGSHRLALRQDPDRPVGPGLYFIRLRTDTGLWRQTLIRVPANRARS